ncbi:MAG TPA: hypothetical protein VGH44_02535 [Candidatus Saccharimonadia bacterium]
MLKRKYKLNLRDVIIGLLALCLIFTNYVLFTTIHNQDITNAGASQAWLYNQYEINKLNACLGNHSSVCDITTGAPKPSY